MWIISLFTFELSLRLVKIIQVHIFTPLTFCVINNKCCMYRQKYFYHVYIVMLYQLRRVILDFSNASFMCMHFFVFAFFWYNKKLFVYIGFFSLQLYVSDIIHYFVSFQVLLFTKRKNASPKSYTKDKTRENHHNLLLIIFHTTFASTTGNHKISTFKKKKNDLLCEYGRRVFNDSPVICFWCFYSTYFHYTE